MRRRCGFYAEAIGTMPGWTINPLITQLTVVKDYNGFLLLPILLRLPRS